MLFNFITRHPAVYGALIGIATVCTVTLCTVASFGLIPIPCAICSGVVTVVCWMTAIAGAAVDANRKQSDANREAGRRQFEAYRTSTGSQIDAARGQILAALGVFAEQHIDAITATASLKASELRNVTELRNGRH